MGVVTMQKVILMIMLATVSNVAAAEWSEIESDDNETVYADLSTIHRNGDSVKMWLLRDVYTTKIIRDHEFLSEKRLNEYDCNTEEMRSYAASYFSKNMGNGDVVFSEEAVSYWKLIQPGTVDYSSLKVACKRFYEFWKYDLWKKYDFLK